jgi:hypothetical protein
LVLISCGEKFNLPIIWLSKLYLNFIFSLKLKHIIFLSKKVPNIRSKTALNIIAEHPKHLGILSCLKIISEYNFSKIFKKISLNEQVEFSKIPILAINGRLDLISTKNSLLRLEKKFNNFLPLLNRKKTVISSTNKIRNSNFNYQIYPWSGHNPMDTDIVSFIYDLHNFM